jgi:hypothetical protein
MNPLHTDLTYTTPAERRVAEHAATHARLVAGRHGWSYRTAIAALEHLEAHGAVRCVAARGRGWWALAGR